MIVHVYRKDRDPEGNKKKCVAIPYAHKIAHNLKKVGSRYGLNVVFSAPNKLGKICAKLDRKLSTKKNLFQCNIKHASPFVECRTAVVYCLPMSCRKMYIGQTGRCVNTRLSEHKRSLTNNAYSHIRRHCLDFGCKPLFSETVILSNHKDQLTREVIEAFHITKRKDDCISQPSVVLSDSEVSFLENH